MQVDNILNKSIIADIYRVFFYTGPPLKSLSMENLG